MTSNVPFTLGVFYVRHAGCTVCTTYSVDTRMQAQDACSLHVDRKIHLV